MSCCDPRCHRCHLLRAQLEHVKNRMIWAYVFAWFWAMLALMLAAEISERGYLAT